MSWAARGYMLAAWASELQTFCNLPGPSGDLSFDLIIFRLMSMIIVYLFSSLLFVKDYATSLDVFNDLLFYGVNSRQMFHIRLRQKIL